MNTYDNDEANPRKFTSDMNNINNLNNINMNLNNMPNMNSGGLYNFEDKDFIESNDKMELNVEQHMQHFNKMQQLVH